MESEHFSKEVKKFKEKSNQFKENIKQMKSELEKVPIKQTQKENVVLKEQERMPTVNAFQRQNQLRKLLKQKLSLRLKVYHHILNLNKLKKENVVLKDTERMLRVNAFQLVLHKLKKWHIKR